MSTEEPMSIEDRVRTATRAGATLVRDIGPLAAPDPVRLRRRPAPAARRWRSLGIPLAAAAAVVLVALSLVAVRQFGTPAPSAGRSATTAPAAVPRYFAALDYDHDNSEGEATYTGPLIVGDDVTGTVIDTISAPHGRHFVSLTGTSDDRMFVVLAANRAEPAPDYTLYLLRIAPGTRHPYQLTELPVRLPGDTPVVFSYALSPDGRELAVESGIASTGNVITLGIYSASSGAELRAWTTDAAELPGPALSLSWLSEGRQLAFTVSSESGPYPGNQLRTLDVTGSGTDLMAASRALFPVKSPIASPSDCWAMSLTPDGGTVICGTQSISLTPPGTSAGCANGGLEFTAYSVRTGQPVRVLYRYRGACSNGESSVLWTDASATSVIGATEINVAGKGGNQAGQVGVITGGHIRLLKLPKSVSPTDYGTVAF